MTPLIPIKLKQSLKKFLRFLISKVFLINLAIAIVLGLGILWGIYVWLKDFTHHNESLSVPDLKGMHLKEAKKKLKKSNLNYVVSDSTYVPNTPPLTVIEHQPEALDKVKLNRKIYLTINKPNPPKETVPANLKDNSLRQVLKVMKAKGFTIGEYIYESGGVGRNTLKRLEVNGETIEFGSKLPQGTKVDLVLYEGKASEKVEVPDLIGLSMNNAKFYMTGKNLNFGSVIYDSTVADSSSAIIYKQRPLPKIGKKVAQGEIIDVWLTSKQNYERQNAPDTTGNFR